MDWPYNYSHFHGPKRGREAEDLQNDESPKRLRGAKSLASFFETASQAVRDPIGTAGTIAEHTVRSQIDAISNLAYYTWHPVEGLRYLSAGSGNETIGETKPKLERRRSGEDTGHHTLDYGDYEKLAKRTRLQQELQNATSWKEYSAKATELGHFELEDDWKQRQHYDADCVKRRLRRLEAARDSDDLEEMLRLVRMELTRDLGGICNPLLHQRTVSEAKTLIECYIVVVGEVLQRIVTASAHSGGPLNKRIVEEQLKQTRRSYGRTALLLSGGGTLGMNHIGVIKALHEADAMPRIISGSSAGAIVGSVLATRSDEELSRCLVEFCHDDLAVFVGLEEEQGLMARTKYYLDNGCLFNVANLERIMKRWLNDMTFLEAKNLTGRILNITVSSADQYESQQLLNYSTAPNIVIRSAVVASCSIPFGFNPSKLLRKDPVTKILEPWDRSTLHVDGSIEGDLPTDKVSAEFNVNYCIVSQVNPHVTPFLRDDTKEQSSRHRFWNTTASLAKDEALSLLQNLGFLAPRLMDIGSLVLGQRYSGDITIVPVDSGTQFFDIMSNPTPEFMEAAMQKGERATWPKLAMIKNHLAIELLIDQAFHRVKEHISFSESVSDLRRLQISQNGKSKHASGGRVRPGSKGSYGSARSTIVPRPLQNRRPDHRSVKSMLDAPSDIQGDFVMKVPGEASSPSSRSSSSSFILGSDDEDEMAISPYPEIVEPDAIPSTIQSEPNTPPVEKRNYFDTTPPRSGSPVPPIPISLSMTPAHPRPRSPIQARHASQPRRAESKGTAPTATIKFGGDLSWQAKKLSVLQMPKKLLGKRSGSTGRSGVSETRRG